jgi:YVTN family beta-propeller protein
LSTGKKITQPPLGVQENVGSLTMNLVLSPDGRHAVATDMGFHEAISVIDTTTGALVGQQPSPPSADTTAANYYYGMAFAPLPNADGSYTLYASLGSQAAIGVYHLSPAGALIPEGMIALQTGDFPAGIAVDARGYLYVAINEFYTANFDLRILTNPGQLAVYNTTTGLQVGRVTVGSQPMLSNFPLAVAALADGSRVYVSSQRDGAVYVFNAAVPASPVATGALLTGAHPDALLLNRAQTRLYVGNAHSDTVSVISTGTDSVVGSIPLRPNAAQQVAGATPTGLALSADEKTLYATLGDMNAVAVIDPVGLTAQGYIPVGWYPTGIVASPFKKQILVSDAKGTQPRYPNPGYQQFAFNDNPQYDLNLIQGQVQTVAVPNSVQLSQDTQQVLANNRVAEIGSVPAVFNQIGLRAGGITHVIYMIKENRTYDQVLGDLPGGDGDPTLALFGQSVTPNQHALASRFVLLDNFFDCSEASGDGWPWSTQSMATEYVIKNLPYNYSNRGRQYDFEGQNNGYMVGGFPATGPDGTPLVTPGTPLSGPAGAPAVPDVSEAPAHHIWDAVEAAGLSIRNYGFFLSTGVAANGVTLIPDNYPSAAGLREAGHYTSGPLTYAGSGKSDYDFRRFDTSYPDSDAPGLYGDQGYSLKTYGKFAQGSRFGEWNREFQAMMASDPTGNTVPSFQMVRFMNDHTAGVTAGVASPQAHVADNDYSVGQMVQALSQYPTLWAHTALFVIEDDSQDGPDHVDCHRSTCYVISPYIKKNSVDHTFYNTDSVLKTMELLLGVPPLSQYDAVATPILDFGSAPGNSGVYTAILPAQSIITDVPGPMLKRGTPLTSLEKQTAGMDLIHPDSAPASLLNEVIWKSVRGVSSKMPAPVHNAKIEARLHMAPGAGAADSDDGQ